MKNILVIYFILLYSTMYAQSSFNKIYRIDSEQTSPCAFGGNIVSDTAFYFIGVAGNEDYHYNTLFLKTDTSGNMVIKKMYGSNLQDNYMWYSNLQVSNDNNLISAGMSVSYNTDTSQGNSAVILTKIKATGDTIFWRNYYSNDSLHRYIGWTRGLTTTIDGGYIIYCSAYQSLLAIKTDENGNEITRYQYSFATYEDISAFRVMPQVDSGFIFTLIASNGSEYDDNLNTATIMFKIDKNGEKLWEYITNTQRNIYCAYIRQMEDKGYILYGLEVLPTYVGAGNVDYNYVAYITRLDSNRNMLWEKKIGQPNRHVYFSDMLVLNNGYYFVGSTITKDSMLSKGWLFKMSENGDSIWSQYYTYPDFYGTFSNHWLGNIKSFKDGFLLSGSISNDLPMSDSRRGYWGWLVRTDSMGNVSPLLNTTITEPMQYEQPDMRVFPNPTNGILNLQLAEALQAEADIVIYTIEGKEVYRSKLRKQNDNTRLYLYHLPQGFYNCVLQVSDNQVYSKSFFKIN